MSGPSTQACPRCNPGLPGVVASRMFRGSSAVEQSAVNRPVVGSIPTRGATNAKFADLVAAVDHLNGSSGLRRGVLDSCDSAVGSSLRVKRGVGISVSHWYRLSPAPYAAPEPAAPHLAHPSFRKSNSCTGNREWSKTMWAWPSYSSSFSLTSSSFKYSPSTVRWAISRTMRCDATSPG